MDGKLTRRVVLGSIAGGLATGVLAIRALKGRYRAQIPQIKGSYEQEWENYVKLIDVPIQRIDGPSTFTLDYRPAVGAAFQGISLYASYDRNSYPARYPQAPFFFCVGRGKVAAISLIAEDKPALSISVEKRVTKSRAYTDEKQGSACALVPSDDGISYYELRNGALEKLPAAKVNVACVELAAGLVFEYPKKQVLRKGTTWRIPETREYSVELPCEIVGFAKVAGRDTVQIMAERHLDNQEVRHYVTCRTRAVARIEEERGCSFDLDKAIKERVKEVTEEDITQVFRVVSYVDMDTGISVRQEWSTEIRSLKAPHSAISITQMQS